VRLCALIAQASDLNKMLSTGVQKIYWNDNTQTSVHNFINTYGMLRSLYKNTSLPEFLVQSLLLKLMIIMQLSPVQLLQKLNLNQKYVLKLPFLQSTAYIFAGI